MCESEFRDKHDREWNEATAVNGAVVGTVPSEIGNSPLLLTIWTRPRVTIRRIIADDPGRHTILLASLVGIGRVFDRAAMKSAGDAVSTLAIVLFAVVVGPIAGLIGLWLASLLVETTGRWLGGRGNYRNIRAAVAWGWVPTAFGALLWFPQIALFGSDLFTEETPLLDANPNLVRLLFLAVLIDIILLAWGTVLMSNTVAEVQGFRSAWMGFANLLLAGVVLVLVLLAFVITMMATIRVLF